MDAGSDGVAVAFHERGIRSFGALEARARAVDPHAAIGARRLIAARVM
jgi:hypothetical protein